MPAVYQSDPNAAPDGDFQPGRLELLVAGNRGRLLDARRTPIAITAVAPEIGSFELEILAFEDAGARWLLPLEDVSGFQFALDAGTAPATTTAALEAAVVRFDQPLVIECDAGTRDATLARLANACDDARTWLAAREAVAPDLDAHIASREGDPRLYTLLDEYLTEQNLGDLDREFSATFVSNPRSGEMVKGHAIVLAELGLCPYNGKVVRDPATFEGVRPKQRRADHLLARLAFTQALWQNLGHETVLLYRGGATEARLEARAPSFVSATFSRAVAEEHHAGSADTREAALWSEEVPLGRVLMTFLESPALNSPFKEAEAVLIGTGGGAGF